MAEAWVKAREDAGGLLVEAGGGWTILDAGRLDRPMRDLEKSPARRVRIDLGAVDRIDTAGAWLIHRAHHALAERGAEVELAAASGAVEAMLDQVARRHAAESTEAPRPLYIAVLLNRVGEGTVSALTEARALLAFLGQVVVTAGTLVRHPGRLRYVSVVHHMEQTGLNALPIVGLLTFLIGVVLAYQGASQLIQFGAAIFTVDLLAVSVLREIGILITAIIVAGRSGSAFTAEIGTMKVNEEVDAMRTLGLDPVTVLVLPRMIALVLCLPLLALFADVMGIIGGGMICYFVLDIPVQTFIQRLHDATSIWSYALGIIKAPFFAFIIALVGCFQGLQVSGGAGGVGRLTTVSVVESIFLVMVADAAFSILFSILGV